METEQEQQMGVAQESTTIGSIKTIVKLCGFVLREGDSKYNVNSIGADKTFEDGAHVYLRVFGTRRGNGAYPRSTPDRLRIESWNGESGTIYRECDWNADGNTIVKKINEVVEIAHQLELSQMKKTARYKQEIAFNSRIHSIDNNCAVKRNYGETYTLSICGLTEKQVEQIAANYKQVSE